MAAWIAITLHTPATNYSAKVVAGEQVGSLHLVVLMCNHDAPAS